MNRTLIFQLSLFGLFMAFATIYFIPTTIEPVCWLFIFILSAYQIAKKCYSRYFLHGFLVSMLNSVWITTAHILFFGTYISTHADELLMMSNFPIPYSPRVAMLLMGPVFGAVSGIVLGIFSLIASKLIKK